MRAFVVRVDPSEVELASDALWGMGVVAVEERLQDDGTVELWTSLGDSEPDLHEWPSQWAWRYEQVDEGVADTWREFATVIEVEPGLVVRPAWVPYEAPADTTVLHIEPGATFGMGDHPTTLLSLRAVRRLVRPGDTVLDVGCGSGVLAIGACVFGAGSAVGIDIAPAAVPVTEANAAANAVGERVTVSTTDLADLDGEYDLVVANILAPTLVALAPDLRRVMRPGGRLVISGILDGHYQHVLDALAPLAVEAADTLDGWAAVTLR
ncbi:MAG TPA: 50S ribosomal protein L11 methyltransferase [Ilumatobacteraceae bacterium]|nr:50S ribosomal protein L11 methyltransferase [Ilumatobacteraceae bacterium]